MNTDFQILLISDDPYHQGLLKGYCHAHHYKMLETSADMRSIIARIQMQPNLIILAAGLAQGQAQKTDFDLIREVSINHQIPVYYLRDANNDTSVDKDVACWVDAILDAPLDIDQLNDYLHIRFMHHPRFIQEKRSHARRAASDRRQVMLEQKNMANGNSESANNTLQNGDVDCFMVEPFLIDQRSKSVLLNGKSLNLTRKEFELFELLAQDVERVFLSNEIINRVWPENNRVTKSDLYQYMHLLRKKIENDPNNPHWILTVKGFGYKLNVPGPAKVNPPVIYENTGQNSS